MVQIALFITAIVSLLFALVVFMNNPRAISFRLYLLFGVLSSLWMSVNAVVIGEPLWLPTNVRFQFAQLITPLALATSLAFLLFLQYFTRRRLSSITATLITLSLLVGLFTFSDLNVYLNEDGVITLGGLYPFYLFALLLNIAFVFHSLYNKYASVFITKVQLYHLRLGAVTAIAPIVVLGAILPLFTESELSNVGPLFSIAFLFFAGVAMVRHRLFDIKLAAVRTVAYALSVVVLASIYYSVAYIVSLALFGGEMTSNVSLSPINVIIALILVFIFQPIKLFFDKVTDTIFYRDNYKSEDFFAEFGSLLASTTDLRGLLERASDQIAATFKAEQAFFHLYYTNVTKHHMSAGTRGHAKLPGYDSQLLDDYFLNKKDKIVLTDFLEDKKIQHMLQSHKIALVMPLRHSDKITGYVMLGDHLGGYYAERDMTVLTSVSNELIIAIQNALSLHEVKELNATLQQRIDVATKELRSSNAQLRHLDEVKDEFISMASHQLRTPLTSVKGYISMLLDGDVGTVTPQQQKVLSEAYNSSERMVRLIADFLNVSRLQTGKFIIEKTRVDVKKLVEHEVANLKIMASSRDMTLDLTVPENALWLEADEAKLREVVMNFIDNAMYYSPAGSLIKIELKQRGDTLEFTVKDKGIGVPEAEQAQLFHKFYRATNARRQRPDGTGVGLYLARRVMTAHGGKMIFASREGKGSTFGFSLPFAKAMSEDQ